MLCYGWIVWRPDQTRLDWTRLCSLDSGDSLSTDDNAIRSVLHHHPDHLVYDPAPTSGGEDDFTHEEVLLKGLFAGRSGGLDVSLGHDSSRVK